MILVDLLDESLQIVATVRQATRLRFEMACNVCRAREGLVAPRTFKAGRLVCLGFHMSFVVVEVHELSVMCRTIMVRRVILDVLLECALIAEASLTDCATCCALNVVLSKIGVIVS